MAMMRDKVAGTNGKLARCYVHLGVPDRRHPVIAGRWASSWRPSALGSGVRLLITGSSPLALTKWRRSGTRCKWGTANEISGRQALYLHRWS
jgi:hypothetical protein